MDHWHGHVITMATAPLPRMGRLPMMIESHHLSADCLMDTRSSERVWALVPSARLPVPLW